MKRFALILLSVLLCVSLFSCENDTQTSSSSEVTSSQEVTSSESVSSVAATSSEEVVSAESQGSTSSQLEKIYLELDETKSKEYNDAIKAYNTFLNYKCYEINEYGEEFGRDPDKYYSVRIYTLFDMSHDGVPELLAKGPELHIFSYQEGEVVLSYVDKDDFGPMSHYNSFLEDGSLVTGNVQVGNRYWFRKFIDNDLVTYVSFYDSYYEGKYYFKGEEVSKEEYDELTKDYFEAMKKRADLTWYEYSLAK